MGELGKMVWSKPAPSKDWPLHESLYEGSGSSKRVGRIVISKTTYALADRGAELFVARAFIRLIDGGPGAVQLGHSGDLIAPSLLEHGAPVIGVGVQYSSEGYWRWVCDRAADVIAARSYPNAWWFI